MEEQYLELSPPELKFRFELRKSIPVTLTLKNPGSERIAFKVKTTSPKKYCVRPSSGYVEPGTTKEVQVILQAQREQPQFLGDCKDKFLIQTVPISSEIRDVTADLFDMAKGAPIKQTKLRVVMTGPAKPPSPVPEGVEEEASPAKSAFKENGIDSGSRDSTATMTAPPSAAAGGGDLVSMTRERNRLRDQLTKVEMEKADIKKRLETLEAAGKAGGGGAWASQPGSLFATDQISLVHVLVAALIAFLIGKFVL